MDNQSFLTLRVQDLRYAIATTQVLEIIKLPELMPVANMPDDIIGILNYRGLALPVMQLSRRLGKTQDQCSLSDSLIVVEWQDFKVGIVVHTVEEVQEIESQDIATGFSLGRESDINVAFLSGVATLDDEMVMLLNPEALIRKPDALAELTDEAKAEDLALGGIEQSAAELTGTSFLERYCPWATEEERAVFRQRAEALRPVQGSSEEQAFSAVAVMRLGEDYFGLDLNSVREFIQVSGVTPLPCCPQHILGNMNLRGEVMTLVDIRSALRVAGEAIAEPEKAIVVDVDDIVAGITVDQVCDIVQFDRDEIASVPVATTSNEENYVISHCNSEVLLT